MGYRTLIVKEHAKLELSLGSIFIRRTEVNETKAINIDEVNLLIIETPNVAITASLLSELINKKVRVIFCDEKHNPQFECMPYYGTSDSSLKVRSQIQWSDKIKNDVWERIIWMKIENQSRLLKALDCIESYTMLQEYKNSLESGDITNREGHAAKVYFNSLFGMSFSRRQDTSINAKLNYGYAILLSMCSREIASLGYITQLGIHHDNQDNIFNLSCDCMEPFRPIIDSIVIRKFIDGEFDVDNKNALISTIMNTKVIVYDKVYSLDYAVGMFVQSVMNAIENNCTDIIKNFDYEY